MTEKERTIYAKKYIDMLANGINPIDGSTLPDSDIVNNIHIARCLFYVSGLLDRIINSANNKSAKKQPFQINDEEVGRITLSNTPIAASELAKRINKAVENSDVKKLTYQNITSWLVSINLLEDYTSELGKTKKRPTEDGNRIGISIEQRFSRDNVPYTVVVYSRDAQQFIIDNLQAIVAFI